MPLFSRYAWLSLLAASTLILPAAAKPPGEETQPIYTVDVYDPMRDPEQDLNDALAKARQEKKRVLVQVGGDWCGWCHRMTKYFASHEKVAAALARDYLIMKVNYSEENRNQEFLGQRPKIKGYPHLFVYDDSGKLLHSQNTADLEEGESYSEAAVLEFLSKWAAKK